MIIICFWSSLTRFINKLRLRLGNYKYIIITLKSSLGHEQAFFLETPTDRHPTGLAARWCVRSGPTKTTRCEALHLRSEGTPAPARTEVDNSLSRQRTAHVKHRLLVAGLWMRWRVKLKLSAAILRHAQGGMRRWQVRLRRPAWVDWVARIGSEWRTFPGPSPPPPSAKLWHSIAFLSKLVLRIKIYLSQISLNKCSGHLFNVIFLWNF